MESRGPSFVPPFCPRADCRYHTCAAGFRWVRHGFYRRQGAPQRIQRFRCVHGGHTFSVQSFSVTYWLRRPLLELLFHRLTACSGFRQIAREARCHSTTVMRQAARLGRLSLLFLHEQRPRGPLAEPLVLDGFETFEFSQYHPCHLHLAVGARSHFAYGFTDSELRRKGRMRPDQKRRRAWLERHFGRPDPRALEQDVAELLRLVVPEPRPFELRSDDHPAYRRALRRLPHPVTHRVTPGSAPRTWRSRLFPVNLLDLLIRHNSANHKRETIAFSKRRQGALERLAVLLVWRNWMQPFSERRGGSTPAMRLGLTGRRIPLEELLERRRFPGRVGLPPRWELYYRRLVPTRRIPRGTVHDLRLAF